MSGRERDRCATRHLGARLRDIRRQQGLSLAQVQVRSDGRWKAVVVGAYERGDRAITIERLDGLARFYGVPVADLLPDPVPAATEPSDDREAPRGEVLDLTLLDARDPRIAAVVRFADRIRRRRGDHNGRVLTLRHGDLALVALATGADPIDLRDDLAARGVLHAHRHPGHDDRHDDGHDDGAHTPPAEPDGSATAAPVRT